MGAIGPLYDAENALRCIMLLAMVEGCVSVSDVLAVCDPFFLWRGSFGWTRR